MTGCIDIALLKEGTRLTIGTPHEVWEMEVVRPETGLVRVSGTDRDFKHGSYHGRVLGSVGQIGGPLLRERSIIKGARVKLDFKNATATTNRIDSVLIEGKNWHYEI